MEMGKEILGMLHEIKDTLNDHSQILKDHGRKLDEHNQKLDMHSETLKEHGLILGALKNGQEMLKAELSEIRLQNAKEFGEFKEQMKDMGDSIDILKEDTWHNKKDILRIKKTMGMA
ncbi:hypothetical protein [Lederbergia panacisoli]|uniref:hypothetical protein n=1 Tax=Lederbergia panacisoli TaxID=1255251 RepID=UPI00214B89B9|nr:hypothetical protein [Lederbergia panacisoli]MCR2821633.1 hypothetical protein [Lederbergia panacisoli]